MKTILLLIILQTLTACSMYKSYGRKEFESKSPDIVRSLNKAQAQCWTQAQITETNPIDIKTHQMLEQSERTELWINTEQNLLTEIEMLSEELFSVCEQKVAPRP